MYKVLISNPIRQKSMWKTEIYEFKLKMKG